MGDQPNPAHGKTVSPKRQPLSSLCTFPTMDPFMSDLNSFYSQQDLPWPLESMQFDTQLQPPQQQDPVASSPYIQPIPFMSHQQAYSGPMPANNPNIIPLGMLPQNQPHPDQHYPQPQQPQLDANGQPVKIRKKPGRKPNPASPALRKAQNRAAQRAFRERKERHLRDLEGTIRQLREQRNNAVKELSQVKAKLDGCKAENWYLRGVVLTLQFICLHYNIQIPTHSPYLTEDALSDIAQTSPHAIEAYVNAYTRNNIDLKPTMASQFAHLAKDDEKSKENISSDDDMMSEAKADDMPDLVAPQQPHTNNTIDPSALHHMPASSPSMDADETMSRATATTIADMKFEDEDNSSTTNSIPQEPSAASLSAIHRIRLQLRVQSALSNLGQTSVRLQPTLLQLAISHDPRIDLIPTPHMRDRMIIFRDLMDYDRCFSMLLNGAVYHGGDPTMSESWELPPEFFSEFWYLAINYDLSRTNKWRLQKGLPAAEIKPKENQHLAEEDPNTWGDELLDQFTEPMPSLQPLSSSKMPKSPPQRSRSKSPSHPMYEQLRSPPELRNPIHSPSLDAMMDIMTLATDSR
ncbi:hypothetical protein BJV82DRAFT_620582 [Fennellomyces sp. T-0311]|nr:hypothetical protein BJV82DRAFT_620582 [Fennellomyces sp. T-0311]